MKNDQKLMEDLLVKCMLGEANESELNTVTKWRRESHQNEQLAQQFLALWQAGDNKFENNKTNIDEAWLKLRNRIEQSETSDRAKRVSMSVGKIYFLRVAAAFLLTLCASWVYRTWQQTAIVVAESGEVVRKEKLPDGSIATLNKSATISYPQRFGNNTRNVTIIGEAFFEVVPNAEKPFIIDANGTIIKVVGTSFNVKTSQQNTEVIVETGIVEVSKKSNTVTLHPKEKCMVSVNSPNPIKDSLTDMLYNYYRSQRFECLNISLKRVVAVLNEAYNANIVIANPDIENLKFNTNLINQKLEDNLDIIAETLEVSIEKSGDKFILK